VILTPCSRCGCTAWAQSEFRFRRLTDWEKQGKTGLDAGAPREASDSILCERGKPTDKPVSPLSFPNEIRTAMNANRKYKTFGCGYMPPWEKKRWQ